MYVYMDTVQIFKFKPDFISLDGVYKVTQCLTYGEIVDQQFNMVEELYGKVGKNATDWTNDVSNYIDDKFYKLESLGNVLDPEIVYIPESIIDTYPDSNVKEYTKVMMMINLGVFHNPTLLTTINTKIKELLQSETGILVEPILSVYEKVWMSDTTYASIELNREDTKKCISNLFTENKKLIDEVARLNNKVASLESILIP